VEQALKSFPIPRTMGEALRLAADEADQLAKQKPKVDYYDSQMRNPGLMTTTEIAKDFGWSAKKLNDFLHDHHVIYPVGSGKKKKWVIYQKYADKGYTQYEPYDFKKINGQHGIKNNLKWTQRGKKFIYDLLADFDIHPVLEQMDLLGM
ncbi:MAG: phage antirepressor KilAC domain-containing protein, partial [Lactobacillus crispatus]|nr:phage antirepressor KilAC domain-containing protein [Lactobacillus crispatus]MCT7879231.1 phage antirepressor KilAC domain-containing protein [Lactobacillus crispatus]